LQETLEVIRKSKEAPSSLQDPFGPRTPYR